MYCWSCYWGWPKVVADIYERALIDLGGDKMPLLYGPAHIVWDDENFDSAEWCLENFDKIQCDYSQTDLEIVRRSLSELALVPISDRCVEPEYYDGFNPEAFSPPHGVVMVKM
jgi:hypothetical protein